MQPSRKQLTCTSSNTGPVSIFTTFTIILFFLYVSIKQNLHGDATSGVSTGTAVLSTLQNDDNVESINVFGMNFNGGFWHVDFNDPNLSNICCTKCVFHKTSIEQYK